jgi:hypothetical protein
MLQSHVPSIALAISVSKYPLVAIGEAEGDGEVLSSVVEAVVVEAVGRSVLGEAGGVGSIDAESLLPSNDEFVASLLVILDVCCLVGFSGRTRNNQSSWYS